MADKIIDHISFGHEAYRFDQFGRRRSRDLSDINALVLHQMGFNRGTELDSYNKVKAHFVILQDGTLGQLHPLDINLMASDTLNDLVLL